jgi:hypothetical protein
MTGWIEVALSFCIAALYYAAWPGFFLVILVGVPEFETPNHAGNAGICT